MADGDFFPKPISKDESNNAVDNVIYVQLSDGSAAVGVTSGALDVNIANASVVVTATDLDIRDLVAATDSVSIGDGTDTLDVNADGSINVLTTLNVDDAAGATDAVFPAGAVRDDVLSALTPVEGDYVNLRTDANGALWVNIGAVTDLDIRDLTHVSDSVKVGDGTDFLAVNTDGSINVNIVEGASSDEYHVADIGTPIANGTDTHTVTASGGVMLVTSITVSSSGGLKYVAKNNGVEVMTGFLGRDGNTDQIIFSPPVEVADTQAFTIERTNRQGVANDCYSTVMGRQL